MGRSLEVRRKSENLPVAGSTFIRDPIQMYGDGNLCVLASWNAGVALRPDANCTVVGFGLNEENRRCSRGNGGFFYCFFQSPRDKGRIERKEVILADSRQRGQI